MQRCVNLTAVMPPALCQLRLRSVHWALLSVEMLINK